MSLRHNPLPSPRLFRLDVMIKHDFLFSLDLGLVYLFSSLDRNSNLIIIVRNVSTFFALWFRLGQLLPVWQITLDTMCYPR